MRTIITIVCLLYAFFLSSSIQSQDCDIQGTWKLIAKHWDTETKQFADATVYKIITDSYWITIGLQPATQELYWTNGGTYSLDDRMYAEKLEFFSLDTSVVGNINMFEMSVQDDVLCQKGVLSQGIYAGHKVLEYYERIEPGLASTQHLHPIAGVWSAAEAQYGNNPPANISQEYGRILKVITPTHFAAVFANPNTGWFGGIAFGTQKIIGQDYIEKLLCFSWDSSVVEKPQIFQWRIEDGEYIQTGPLSADSTQYDSYQIKERYRRLE